MQKRRSQRNTNDDNSLLNEDALNAQISTQIDSIPGHAICEEDAMSVDYRKIIVPLSKFPLENGDIEIILDEQWYLGIYSAGLSLQRYIFHRPCRVKCSNSDNMPYQCQINNDNKLECRTCKTQVPEEMVMLIILYIMKGL